MYNMYMLYTYTYTFLIYQICKPDVFYGPTHKTNKKQNNSRKN